MHTVIVYSVALRAMQVAYGKIEQHVIYIYIYIYNANNNV